ncbi:MAG TPA: HEAT repeat domain-containing protein [Pyrinomonadaceae bacterium]|nr:HEAT repeat domain-containing protein [Pyrinomonadaceae bacterium]
MSRIVLALLIGLLCCGPAFNAAAQKRKIDSDEVLKQLLAMPAPAPHGSGYPMEGIAVDNRPIEFFSRDNPPPDNAPAEDVVAYWSRWIPSDREPPPAHKQRLLEACIADPELLTTFMDFLPDADSTATKVKNIFDKAQADKSYDQSWHDKVRKWLLFNSTYFLDELIAMAHKAKDNNRDGDVDKEEAIWALASLSWTNAEPLLRGLMASGQPRSHALALAIFYEHAIEEKDTGSEERYRRELQAIAADRNQPGYARYTAIENVALSEWSGRDDWYLSLFNDESLLELSEGGSALSPLDTLFLSDAKKWVPIIGPLTESKDINVRSAAASCLTRDIGDEETRKQALKYLLPWLTNSAWANETSNQRLRLLQMLHTTKVPESVPGLIAVVENEDPDYAYARGFAAEALSQYGDARAVPALKRALTKEKDEGLRHRVIKGLLGSGGLSEKDQLEGLEEYAAKLTSPESRMEVMRYHVPQEEPLSVTITIGKFLGQNRETPSESLINMVLARAEELKSQNPALADALLEITHQWQGHQVELDIIRRIGNGSADSAAIVEAIQRRDKLQEGLRTELQSLASVAGAAQGVGAVLLNDPVLAQGILNSEDRPAQIALIACARLTRMQLPVELIGPILRDKNALLTQAAEAYLLAEDSREARELLWQRHPNEGFITGWRENLIYMYNSFEILVKAEDDLRSELFKENGPTEIVAYVAGYTDQRSVLRIYPDKAVFTEYEDPARVRERTIPQGEVAALKDFLATGNFMDRGPTVMMCHHGCPANELLVLKKDKGRRVFNQGGYSDDWQGLVDHFTQFGNGEGAKVHYKLADEIKGLEVLYAGELTVTDVAQQGGELRVAVDRKATKEEDEERDATYGVDDEDDDDLATRLMRRRVEIENSRSSWRVFANGQLGAVTSAPDFYSVVDALKYITGDENDADWESNYGYETATLAPDSILIAKHGEGLWRQFAGSKPVRVGDEASYSNPIATRDGKWVVLKKEGPGEDEKPYIVRLNLQTGREFRVNFPAASDLTPSVLLPSLGKVLIIRDKPENIPPGSKPKEPEKPDYYLLDPATGGTRPVTGDFSVLADVGDRFLQPTEKPDEYWGTLSNDKLTLIGRYSVKDFSFKPVMIVPQIVFGSMTMWVDEGQKKVYVVYKGQLLRLPLQVTENLTLPAGVTKK